MDARNHPVWADYRVAFDLGLTIPNSSTTLPACALNKDDGNDKKERSESGCVEVLRPEIPVGKVRYLLIRLKRREFDKIAESLTGISKEILRKRSGK